MPTRRTRNSNTRSRILSLHGVFAAPSTKQSSEIGSLAEFIELFCEARDLRHKQQKRALRERKDKLSKQALYFPKISKVLRDCFAGKIETDDAGRKIRKICPDRQIAREIFDFLTSPPRALGSSQQGSTEKEADIEESEAILRSWTLASKHVELLANRAQAGYRDAIKDLVEIGHQAVQSLIVVKLTHPQLVRNVSKSKGLWPLLVSSNSSWQKDAARQLEGLELGKDAEIFHVRFASPRGPDENYPARQWAKAAVRTIEETRWRFATYGQYRDEFQELAFRGKANLAEIPDWAGDACRLPFLSKETVPVWGNAIRAMIRQQSPGFHLSPEWENQRKTAAYRSRDTAGEIRNAVLDDIVSALKRVAPDCRNSSAELKQAKKEKLKSKE